MDKEKLKKYKPYPQVILKDRKWPDAIITKAPIWCSVDLRDGNQALAKPMDVKKKLEMFQLLVAMGFKEIEVGFPSASKDDYDFVRKIIEEGLVPDNVVIQVLTQAREDLIKKTFKSLCGVKMAVVHLYNSTSILQRRVVFRKSRQEVVDLALEHTRLIRKEAEKISSDIRFEYSPESFTGTELDFALKICEAVMDEWGVTYENPAIINLPATVEMSTPNIYADQIEWFIRNMKNRKYAIISLHTHNDRGSAVAATELALMAGADRVEGTLFGNGERTGNGDLATLALNLFSQGIDPCLDFSNINHVIDVCERCTGIKVHPRHPYAGELVYTAFSGSHQDAIKKGMEARKESSSVLWEIPYIPIDPEDVGRTYEAIIRINSQSGKGGAAYKLEEEYEFRLPKEMQPEFGEIVQGVADDSGEELPAEVLHKLFVQEYFRTTPYKLKVFDVVDRQISDNGGGYSAVAIRTVVSVGGEESSMRAGGNGPLDAFCEALRNGLGLNFSLSAYHEHSLAHESSAKAISYAMIVDGDGREFWGAGVDSDIVVASTKAVISSLNRMVAK